MINILKKLYSVVILAPVVALLFIGIIPIAIAILLTLPFMSVEDWKEIADGV